MSNHTKTTHGRISFFSAAVYGAHFPSLQSLYQKSNNARPGKLKNTKSPHQCYSL
ncbi:hypothetical protein AB434_3602 [Heyndrickxia coagulans]|uniref:Uncharacterized protein n=1 Tax=Heyndrickxia coagulans TaxID=1398 RepID=A0AAN0T432_HEYCO|nr:hypothetical protein SB48_HM08orf02653 [Heyndrickxia coagulans]AKN56007.1 hypothetical protein AB434_3602 [Heyndrickxia coagulans]